MVWVKKALAAVKTNSGFSQAALVAKVVIKRLWFGYQHEDDKPPFNLFSSPQLCKRIGAVAKNANIVKIRCAGSATSQDWSVHSADPLEMAAAGLGLIYEQTSKLSLLSSTGPWSPPHFRQIYLGKSMPLTVLTLENMVIGTSVSNVFWF